MSFNRTQIHHSTPNVLYKSNPTLPNITFNYCALRPNQSESHFIAKPSPHQHILEPLVLNSCKMAQEPCLKKDYLGHQAQVLVHHDPKRKKIFAKSQSNKDIFTLCKGKSTQNKKDRQDNRYSSESNEMKSKKQRKRNHIFQCYDPKTRIQTSKHQVLRSTADKAPNSSFYRPVLTTKIRNFAQITPKKENRRHLEEIPLITINAEARMNKVPLRDTYVSERDLESTNPTHKQRELGNFLEKQLLEIPIHKVERSFTKRQDLSSIAALSKRNIQNLQLQQESITGYSHREVQNHDEHAQNFPQLFLQTNENRIVFKAEKNEDSKEKHESQSLDIRLTKTNQKCDKTQNFLKELVKSTSSLVKASQISIKAYCLSAFPYALVLLGVILLFIQLLK